MHAPSPPPQVERIVAAASDAGWFTRPEPLDDGRVRWRLDRPGGGGYQLVVTPSGRVEWAGTHGRSHAGRRVSVRQIESLVGLRPRPRRRR